jgi:Sulfatase
MHPGLLRCRVFGLTFPSAEIQPDDIVFLSLITAPSWLSLSRITRTILKRNLFNSADGVNWYERYYSYQIAEQRLFQDPPAGIGYLLKALESVEGINPVFIDCQLDGLTNEDLLSRIRDSDPLVVGLQVFSEHYPQLRYLDHIIALYDGEIAWVDHHLGLIIEELKKSRVFDQTLIVVTADHGDEFFEHGGKGHRNTLYDEVVMIPLSIQGPGVVKWNQEIAEQAGIIDIAPTILKLCGLEPPPWMQGRSLLPGPGDRAGQGDGTVLLELGLELKALRTNPYKLIFNFKHLRTIIFDLARGPEETNQHLVTSPDRWNEANLKFYSRLAADRSLAEKYRGGETGVPVHLSEEEAARLKSLGYL